MKKGGGTPGKNPVKKVWRKKKMRKTWKKLLSLAMAATMTLSLAGCGGGGQSDTGANSAQTPSNAESAGTNNNSGEGSTANTEKPNLDKLTIMVDGTVQFAKSCTWR